MTDQRGNHVYNCRNLAQEMDYITRRKPDSIDIVIDKDEQNLGHALIRGPDETPYEKGFFYFTYDK